MPNAFPKVREDLRVSKQKASGQVHYIVGDPVTGKYIRLREPEFFIFQYLDGKTPLKQISVKLEEQLKINISIEQIEKFAAHLDELLFLESQKGEYLLSHSSRTAIGGSQKKSALFIKLKAFNPERLLEWLYKRVRFIFSPFPITVTILIILAGTYQLIGLSGTIPHSVSEVFGLTTVATAVVALFVVIFMHEFAHALVCRHYGGRVREMGFLLIYFQPAFYSNLSDSYMFTEKKHKIYTILAGMYFQILLGSISVMLWQIIRPGTFISDTLLVIVVVCFVSLLFNLIPFIKLDGYYLLTDLVDIPNLRQKAFAYLKHLSVKAMFGIRTKLVEPSRREKKILVIYAITAFLYSFAILYFVGDYLFKILVSKWEGFGFVLFTAIFLVIFKPLFMSTAKDITEAVREGAIARISCKRKVVWGVLLVALILILVFVKTDLRVSSSATLLPIESFSITAPYESVLRSVYILNGKDQLRSEKICQLSTYDFSVFRLDPLAQEGAEVHVGDTLLTVSSNLYKGELAQIRSELKKSFAEYDLLISDPKAAEIARSKAEVDEAKLKLSRKISDCDRAKKMRDGELISEEEWEKAKNDRNVAEKQVQIAESKYELLKSGPKAEELSVIEADIDKFTAKESYLLEQIEASTFIAPFSGRISSTTAKDEILTLVRTDSMEVLIAAPEQDIDIIAVGQRAVLKVTGFPTKSFHGSVVRIQETAVGESEQKIFKVTVVTPNPDGLLKPGMSGYAKIYCGKKSLGGKLIRGIVRFFRVRFWAWW